MAEFPFFSSQNSEYETHRISLNQENVGASPALSRDGSVSLVGGEKIKRPPTVTPKRFTKFFTPRGSSSQRTERQSKAGRLLRDITRNGVNSRLIHQVSGEVEDDQLSDRPVKRRKYSCEFPSSPLLQSSPLKHVYFDLESEKLDLEDVSSSVIQDEEVDLPSIFQQLKPFPRRIKKTLALGQPKQLLEREFGGHAIVGRAGSCWKGSTHASDWRMETQDFCSTDRDRHVFHHYSVPFTATSCNTNSLVAIGEEEGVVRLVDTGPSADFRKTVLTLDPHKNSIMDIAFSPDDYALATASGDQTCRITDMRAQRMVCILSGHTSTVKQVRFQPSNPNIVTTSGRDGAVLIWDLRCTAQGSVLNLHTKTWPSVTATQGREPAVQYFVGRLPVGDSQWSTKAPYTKATRRAKSRNAPPSVTAIQHLGEGRDHMLVTATELDSSLSVWDTRACARRQTPTPVSITPVPVTQSRNFGMNSLALSGDGARLYALSRDATVYVYSTNHLVSGCAPEFNPTTNRRRAREEPRGVIAPIFGYRHPKLKASSFWVKAAIRPARADKPEMLAVGSQEDKAVLFPTDERYWNKRVCGEHASKSAHHWPDESDFPISEQGAYLERGHDKEVTSVTWTHDGDLVTLSDDNTARCWREDADLARRLRMCEENQGERWGHGWAQTEPDSKVDALDEEDG